jgi:hypothetical protein
MVQGLAVGVGAFAQSAATHGREGGPQAVQAFQSEQQQQQLREQESQQSAQRAQQEQQESDLRNSVLRANMSMQAFQLEQMRLRAPLEIQKAQNEIAEQQLNFMGRLSEATGLPLMVVNSLANDDTQTTLSAMQDTAQKNNTTIHDTLWTHVQNDHAPGNGSNITGLDLKRFGNKIIPAELSSYAMLPIKTQIDTAAGVLGDADPNVMAAKQASSILQKGLDSGQLNVQGYAMMQAKIAAPLASAMQVKHATLASQKEQAETTSAQQAADPAFQVRQAGAKKGAEAAAEVPFAGKKAAAEASATQPYQVALKNLEAPIAAGVQNDSDARKEATKYANDYADRISQVQQLKDATSMAASGNVAAAREALIKLTGITMEPGSKRLSPDAMRVMNSMGSAGQKWVGSITNLLTGNDWTPGMAQDVNDLADQLAAKAGQTLSMKIHQLNAIRQTKIDPQAIIRAANPDQDWSQQTDSAADISGAASGTTAPGGSLADKWKKKLNQ